MNGAWVGVHRNPQELVANLRAMRRQVDINTEVSTCAKACCVAGGCASSLGGACATGMLCDSACTTGVEWSIFTEQLAASAVKSGQ